MLNHNIAEANKVNGKKATVLDYGDIIYEKSESDAIEKCQRKAALICTGAFRLTSNERLLNELGWGKNGKPQKSQQVNTVL